MPTSYTAPIYEGKAITFEEFVWRCARAMGALIHMRDDSLDTPVRDAADDSGVSYHEEQVEKAIARLVEVNEWTDERAERLAAAVHAEAVLRERESKVKDDDLAGRYTAMLDQVAAWEPPTEDHVGLKDFMAQQLRESREFDTGFRHSPSPQMTGPEYREQEAAKAQRNVEYHRAEMEKARERAESRRAWIEALKDSLAREQVSA